MVDIQRLIQIINDTGARERSKYQGTIGALIKDLEAVTDKSLPVKSDMGWVPSASVLSYRGYYSDLAIDRGGPECTAAELLGVLRFALGNTYEGYKGGDYKMTDTTPVWLSSYGECSAIAIMSARQDEGQVTLVTKLIE